MSKASKPQAGAAQTAAPAPEAPHQTPETAAEANLPVTQPEGPVEKTAREVELEAQLAEVIGWQDHYLSALHSASERETASTEEKAELVSLLRQLTAKVIRLEPVLTPKLGAAYAAVRQALQGLDVPEAYVLPDGSWRFSLAAALLAVGNDEEQLVIIPNDFQTAD